MKKNEVTEKDVIHCETSKEFYRIIELFEMDNEYLMWDIYNENTVLYPFTNEYGEIDGYCKDVGLNVISSTEITPV